MRAAIYRECGAARDVLLVADVDTPSPGPGEVLVRVHASGVNPTDYKTRSGATGRPIDDFQVPHQDGAGVIEAVGTGVDSARVGERVWVWFAAAGRRWGTAAEYTMVPSRQAVPLPAAASFELGASLGVPAMTAHRCLFADGPVAGRTILVAGGAGATPQTVVVTYAAEPSNPVLPVRDCMNANVVLRFIMLYSVPDKAMDAAVADVTAALAAGALTELPVHRFPLDDIVAAQEATEGGAVGKVIVAP
jgi:NADPH:quinone reductase-like Zn-dependent oxidoreductase